MKALVCSLELWTLQANNPAVRPMIGLDLLVKPKRPVD